MGGRIEVEIKNNIRMRVNCEQAGWTVSFMESGVSVDLYHPKGCHGNESTQPAHLWGGLGHSSNFRSWFSAVK